jgi:GT2 family glycosyltransferase
MVVDNGAADDSVARVRETFALVELIETVQTIGFAGSCNISIRRARAQGADFIRATISLFAGTSSK